jgi:hypothetical protein
MGLFDRSLKYFANRAIQDIGQFRELHVNTRDKSGYGLLLLRGETGPIDVAVGRYQLVRDGGKVVLQLREVSCSREWLQALATRLESQMNLDLPPALASFLIMAKMV